MDQIIKAPIPDPRTIYPHISDEMVSLMLKLTEKDRVKRLNSLNHIPKVNTTHTIMPTNEIIKQMKADEKEKVNKGNSVDINVGKEEVTPDKPIKTKKKYLWIFIRISIIIILLIFIIYPLSHKSQNAVEEPLVVEELQEFIPSPEMVKVEGGTFQMGSTNGESDEKPVHSVTVSSFFIGKYEVTQKEWQAVMGDNPSHFKGDNKPVEQVTWYQTVEFCNKLSQKEDLTPAYAINGTSVSCNWNADGYRLPSEAEWEFAARGGKLSKDYTYSGSNNLDEVGWYSSNSDDTHEVGTKKANELGIYDMSGNVWEWCWDLYDSYTSSAQTNPRGASSGSGRVGRGG
ncbi:MAG: formylglycine-generating enzyme family protein, partial [Candidatus Cloacimonetes bacterium]|nr:formylglycine-generating enzyme family protein [Candidatus Cloacimonadota bacterium]